jgi:drug/metabolite transporter (DMT)-like permease
VQQYVAFVACCLIWGSTFLAIRIGNEGLPPEWAATLRLALAAPLLALIVVLRRGMWPSRRGAIFAAAYGMGNLGINFALLYWGERVVPSGIAAVLFATVPLTTTLFAAAFGIERLTRRRVIVAVVALAGVATIFAGEMRLDVPFAGLLAIFVGASFASLAAVIFKLGPKQPSAIATNAIGSTASIPIVLAASVLLGEDRTVPTSLAVWWPVLYLVVAGSLGAYVIFTWLLARWPASRASYIGVVIPVIAVILGAFVRQETRAPETYLGAAIVVGSVIVALRGGGPAH